MIKQTLVLLFLAIIFSITPTKSNAQVEALPAVVAGAEHLTKKLSWNKVKWALAGFKHRQIYVYFEDGTQIGDTPRIYRTPIEILNYWAQPKYTDYYGKVIEIKMHYGESYISFSEYDENRTGYYTPLSKG